MIQPTKQLQKVEIVIGDYNFNIFPFKAMTAARLSGEVSSFVLPLLSGATPLLGVLLSDDHSKIGEQSLSIAPSIASAFSSLSGEKLEKLLNELLISNGNISFEVMGDSKTYKLDKDVFDEIFCCDIMGMYTLALEVIKLNFGDFFTKLKTLFGSLFAKEEQGEQKETTENSTTPNSQTLN